MSGFLEIDIFRESADHRGRRGELGGEPWFTRICERCLNVSMPCVKYEFLCRMFRCETRLVPSNFFERICNIGMFPLNLDILVLAVDFMSESDIK